MKNHPSVKQKISNWLEKITHPKKLFNFNGKAVLIAALVLFAVTLFYNIYKISGLGYLLALFFIYSAIALVIAIIGSFLIKAASKVSWLFGTAIIFVIISIMNFYAGLSKPFIWILISILIIFPTLFSSGVYLWKSKNPEKNGRKRKVFGIVLACLGFLGILLSIYAIFIFQGAKTDFTPNVKMMGVSEPPIDAPNPATKGDLEVTRLSYGSGADKHRKFFGSEVSIKTQTVDASGILKSWNGFFGKLRSNFFGFDSKKLPLNAIVWYPKKIKKPLPLILIVHGNHLAEDFSEGGYAYLGEHLASRGYIVASIDENFLNISAIEKKEHLSNENAARGWLLLKHLQLWRNWNKNPSNEFYQKVDMNNIALIGHSRGGEAIGHAALFNKLPSFPDDATQAFDFNFNIRSLVAIAPVDGQYKPGGTLTTLQDVNYFVLQGAQDMDMKSYGGLATYYRVKFSKNFQGFKAGVYINGANHGQFNRVWGRYDQLFPAISQYNVNQLMDQQKQQKIAKIYISAFLDVTLKEKNNYKPLFMDYRYGREWLPENIYFNQFQQSGTVYIATFDEDLNTETTTLTGGMIKTKSLSVWKEQQHKLMWNGSLTNAAYIGWDDSESKSKEASYTIVLPDSSAIPANNRLLTFSLAESIEYQSISTADSQESTKGIDFKIRLEDLNGEKIDFSLSSCSILQPPIQKKLAKFPFLEEKKNSEDIPDFFYFDIEKLSKKNKAFSIDQLKYIRFIFDKTPSGIIILDDLGFMKN